MPAPADADCFVCRKHRDRGSLLPGGPVAGAEHVYAAVIGDAVPHLHVHLIPRYPGTPREYWWDRVDEWPEARRGLEPEIAALVRDLRDGLADTG